MANHGHDAHAGHGHAGHGHAAHGSDKGAAFVGLIGGLIFVLAVVYSTVVWTNGRFAGHTAGAAAPAAGAPQH